MSLNRINNVTAEKIFKEIGTKGSAPLLVLANDGNAYYCKTTTYGVPSIELINEVIVNKICTCWGLKVPEVALVKISQETINHYLADGGQPLSKRYDRTNFSEAFFFGSQKYSPATELESYFEGVAGKVELRKFNRPLDLIKIGVLDLWIGNRDRKTENPNILLTTADGEKFDIQPIDHTAAFCNCTNYQQINPTFLFLEGKFRILTSPIIRSIAKFVPPTELAGLQLEIREAIRTTIESFDDIFECIPPQWGFSKKAKAHLKEVLSNKARNDEIEKSYMNYLK